MELLIISVETTAHIIYTYSCLLECGTDFVPGTHTKYRLCVPCTGIINENRDRWYYTFVEATYFVVPTGTTSTTSK
jgi:hypothetical protein